MIVAALGVVGASVRADGVRFRLRSGARAGAVSSVGESKSGGLDEADARSSGSTTTRGSRCARTGATRPGAKVSGVECGESTDEAAGRVAGACIWTGDFWRADVPSPIVGGVCRSVGRRPLVSTLG